MASNSDNLIAYQGQPGANSDMACRAVYPDMEPLPCPSFEDVFTAVRECNARLAMIPIENSAAGRVADIHHLLPKSELHIIAEHFQPVHHHLLGIRGGQLDELNSQVHLPSIPIVGRGYCVPTAFGCVVGSTYEHTPWPADNALAQNLKMNQDYLPDGYEWRGHQRATRAISSDRNPIVGQVGENLWVSTAHGSMGTSSAAYASAVLTSTLLGLSPTATNHQIELIAPQRFLARQARRGILKR